MWTMSTPVPTPPLNATAASLLGFLHQGPMTGWDLAASVEGSIGNFWNLTRSQVYRELRTLEAAGLVTAGVTGARDRRPHTITDAGREAFRRWIAREPGDDLIRSPLLLTVFFGGHLEPATLARFLTVHRLRHEERLAVYLALRESLPRDETTQWGLACLDFGIEHEQAVLRWLERLPVAAGDLTPSR